MNSAGMARSASAMPKANGAVGARLNVAPGGVYSGAISTAWSSKRCIVIFSTGIKSSKRKTLFRRKLGLDSAAGFFEIAGCRLMNRKRHVIEFHSRLIIRPSPRHEWAEREDSTKTGAFVQAI